MENLEKQTRIRALDGVKGICACVVAFMYHYQHFQPLESPFYRIFKLFYDKGDLAVEIFLCYQDLEWC